MSRLQPLRAFLIVGGAFGGGLALGAGVVREAVAGVWSDYAGLDTLARALTTIDRRYVEPVEPERLAHAAVKGMTDSLDPFSTYHPPEQWRSLADEADSAGVGVGLDLVDSERGVLVARVVPEGPADLAGLVVGDQVTALDDTPVTSAEAASRLLQGRQGTPVVVTGTHADGTPLSLAVVRDAFEDIRVGGGPLPRQLHYIRIGRFTRGTVGRFDQQLGRIEPDTRGLVLDLRGNPGGLLSEAGAVADRFLPGGLVVETVARDGVVDGTIEASQRGDELTLPVVVLIDGQSASAAEVLAGTLQAHGRATLVGSPSYGKGSVQSIVEFEDGGALRLTTAAYRLPGGRLIDHAHPLQPDVLVADPRTESPRRRLDDAIAAHVPDPELQARLRADLAALDDPPVDPQAPAPIPLGADPRDHVGHDPLLDAAIERLARP